MAPTKISSLFHLINIRIMIISFLLLLLHATSSLSVSDTDILLKFKKSIGNNSALSNWDPSNPPCPEKNDRPNWTGVLCLNGKIWGLQLENRGFSGPLDLDPLKDLTSLRSVSFMQNNFDGSFPNVKLLSSLKTAFFSHNKFSGEIPDDAFDGMMSLKKIHLAYNLFSGEIPLSLTYLSRLIEAMLDHNQFEGELPKFQQEHINLNVSSNKLEGPIPTRLGKLNETSFSGNDGLCGEPLKPCPSNKPSLLTIIIIVSIVAAALVAIILAIIIISKRKKKRRRDSEAPPLETSVHKASPINNRTSNVANNNNNVNLQQLASKLTFLRDDRQRFDMPDLLKASAEILGGGTFGSTYKAALSNGSVMVVKRFRHMNNVGKEEFQENMRRLGKLRHSNLLPLVAFYYRKEEKLLVTDYINNVSLAIHLHGNNSKGVQPVALDWQTRLKIVKGISRGLLYLYNELPSVTAPHGHLKSSNVLLGQSYEPLLTDYGLVPVVNQEHAQEIMIAYKSPEYKKHGRITRKTDVWSLGILILEILTAKLPAYVKGNEDEDLVSWSQSVKQEELTADVLDKEIRGSRNCEGEMMKLLKLGLRCCESDVDKRLDMQEVTERIEELRERDGDDDYYSSYASEGDLQSKVTQI